MTGPAHLPTTVLDAYLHHTLPPREHQHIRGHLDRCEPCWQAWNRHRWDVARPSPLYAQLAEFLGADFRPYFDSSRALAAEWDDADPRTDHDIAQFFRTSTSYLYNLAIWEASGNRPDYLAHALPTLAHHGTQTVLDYGCGIGSDTLPLHHSGFDVTACDFDSPSTAFLRWRSGSPIPVIEPDRLGSITEVDTLWVIDTLDHLTDQDDHLIFRSEVQGRGAVDTVRFFDAIEDKGFVEHFSLTKHFNDCGRTRPREYSTGSPIGFRHVLCPEPNSHARQLVKPFEYAQVSIHADLDYLGGNFVANPGLLAFAMADDLDGEWLAMGLAVHPGEHQFSEFEYLGGDTFGLNLNCWGVPQVDGTFRPPGVVLVPGGTAEDALQRYVRVLREASIVPRPTRTEASWWQRPIVSGWGHQCYQADLFRVRSSPERPRDNAAYMLCTQLNYRDITDTLDHRDVPWGTLVIDARWFQTGGLKDIDVGRWLDLRGFIDSVHQMGRRVLLWWSPWDPEGVPDTQCIRYLPDEGSRPNRPGRLSKFGTPTPGKKIAVDVTLPAVRESIQRQVRVALGTDQGCWNADGFKIDHVSAAPGIYGMAFPDDSARLFGIEGAHAAMALIYAAAKEVKPDALIVGQSPNPYFTDVQDMVRLGDVYSHQAATVLPEMRFRAAMARVAESSCLIDCGGWPMPSRAAWREYVREQPGIGVPSLYYLTHLDTTGEPLTSDDYALIRSSWRGL